MTSPGNLFTQLFSKQNIFLVVISLSNILDITPVMYGVVFGVLSLLCEELIGGVLDREILFRFEVGHNWLYDGFSLVNLWPNILFVDNLKAL